jgi:hypothetical protein
MTAILSRPRLFPMTALVLSVDLSSKSHRLARVSQHAQARVVTVPRLIRQVSHPLLHSPLSLSRHQLHVHSYSTHVTLLCNYMHASQPDAFFSQKNLPRNAAALSCQHMMPLAHPDGASRKFTAAGTKLTPFSAPNARHSLMNRRGTRRLSATLSLLFCAPKPSAACRRT